MRICPDSSVLVASLVEYHGQHLVANAHLQALKEQGHEFVFAAHSLAETYSSMTRLPPGWRVAPEVAIQAIEAAFLSHGPVVALTPDGYLALLRSAPSRGIWGGRVYDAVIAATAVQADADAILTLNVRDFAGLEPSLRVLVPGQ